MADLWNNNWESYAHLATVSDFGVRVGAAFIVIDETSFPAMQAPQGVKSYCTADPGDQNWFTAADAALGPQGIQGSTTLISGHCLGIFLRQQTSGADRGYWIYYEFNGTALRATIAVRNDGDAGTTSSSYSITASAGATVWLEGTASSSTIESRVWTGLVTDRPTTATHSITNSLWATGRPGFRKVGSGGTYANTDQTRIVDNPADFSGGGGSAIAAISSYYRMIGAA
jgi:hypothetical protein